MKHLLRSTAVAALYQSPPAFAFLDDHLGKASKGATGNRVAVGAPGNSQAGRVGRVERPHRRRHLFAVLARRLLPPRLMWAVGVSLFALHATPAQARDGGDDRDAAAANFSGRNDLELNSTLPPLIPNYFSDPIPESVIDFGSVGTGDGNQVPVERSIAIWNTGAADLRIDSVDFVDGTNEFSLSLSHLGPFLGPITLPHTIQSSNKLDDVEIVIACRVRTPSLVRRILRVVTNDRHYPVAPYACVVEASPNGAFEKIVFTLAARGAPVITGPVAIQARRPQGPRLHTGVETATLYPDTNAPLSLTTEIPSFLGGGSVVISNFTGSVTVSLRPLPNEIGRAAIRIDGGGFTAPSIRLPSGLETGPNTLTFGPAKQSGGILLLTNGSYTAFASATISNVLFPEGIRMSGNYRGIYDAATGRATVQSQSTDSFKMSDRVRFTPTLNGFWLSWLSGGILEATTNVLGQWLSLTNAVSPHAVDTTHKPQEYFRVRQSTP